jgi:hypothetical protein
VYPTDESGASGLIEEKEGRADVNFASSNSTAKTRPSVQVEARRMEVIMDGQTTGVRMVAGIRESAIVVGNPGIGRSNVRTEQPKIGVAARLGAQMAETVVLVVAVIALVVVAVIIIVVSDSETAGAHGAIKRS